VWSREQARLDEPRTYRFSWQVRQVVSGRWVQGIVMTEAGLPASND
jgi:hypothetical protein